MQTIVKKMSILPAADNQEGKINSLSRQILRHGRCDDKDRNPDQVNLELFKGDVIPDLCI